MESTQPHIALIGHGYWGKNIARNLYQLGALRGVFDLDKKTSQEVRILYPDIHLYQTIDEVLADRAVAGVAISTQARTHAELSMAAIRAGKDVFVEKPLALSYEHGQQVVEYAKQKGRILMVGHLLEYHPAVLRLVELVQSGELGKLLYIYSNRLNLGKFRREENILWSFAPHDIAVILRLVGESPIEVMATAGAYLQPNVADTTLTHLLFDDGLRAHIFVSWLHPRKEQRLVVVGSKKMAVFDDRAAPEDRLVIYDKGADWIDNYPVPRQGESVQMVCERSEPLRVEMSHFITCMETREQPRTDGRSGLRVLHVLQAAQQSLQMGGSRVPLWHALQLQLASL